MSTRTSLTQPQSTRRANHGCQPILATLLLLVGLLACSGGGGSAPSPSPPPPPSLAFFAGNLGGMGCADGTGAAARFS